MPDAHPTLYLTDDGELPDGFILPEPLPLAFDRESILSRVRAVNDQARRGPHDTDPPLLRVALLTALALATLAALIVGVALH